MALLHSWLLATAFASLAAAEAVQSKHILHFSDVHLNLSMSLSETESEEVSIAYGDDSPITLLTSALTYAKQLLASPELVLYTGDHAVHGDLADEYLSEAVETNVETLEKFYPSKNGTTLVATTLMGNTDTNPEYAMNVTDGDGVNSAVALVASAWNDSLSRLNMEEFKRTGYLQYDLDDNLAVLALNTIPYSPRHLPDTTNDTDPFGQFVWLNSTLAMLTEESRFAFIVGHIPPMIDSYSGEQMWEASYIATYKRIVGNYSSVVKAQLFGHVHSIEFRVPLDEEQNSTAGFELVPLFTTAAISPIFDNNPAFMIWDFHPTTYDLLDFAVYGANITDGKAGDLSWMLLFNASKAYGVSSLATSELNRFIERAAADPGLIQTYYYNSKAQSYRQSPCLDAACWAKWLCTLRWWTTSEEYENCVVDTETTSGSSSSSLTLTSLR